MAQKKSGGGAKAAVTLGVLLAVAANSGHHHHGHGILATLTSAGGGGGGSAGCRRLERLWVSAGGSPAAEVTAASVAMAESSGNANATNYNTNGTVDRGYWQINSIWGAQSTFSPTGNARAAVAISHNGSDWSPWTTYNSGAYAGRC